MAAAKGIPAAERQLAGARADPDAAMAGGAHHARDAAFYDRRSTAVGDARFDVDKADLRFGTEEVLSGRPDREAQYRDDRQRR